MLSSTCKISNTMQLFVLQIFKISISLSQADRNINNTKRLLTRFEGIKWLKLFSYIFSRYPLNKRDIFTGSYFHILKISKVLFSHCENNMRLWRHGIYCMHCLRFERNMFKIQRKCNKQKTQWFWRWIWNLFHSWDRILKYFYTCFALVKIPVSLVK